MRRDVAKVLSLSALAQVAAFGKSILIAYYFGIGVDIDGYYLGQAIPVTITGILVGFLQTGFLTVYAGQLARAESANAAALLGRMLSLLAVSGVLLSVAMSVGAPWLISVLASDSAPQLQTAAVSSLRVLAFLLLLNAFVDCLSLALSAHGFFAVAAIAPTINALVASALLALLPGWGIDNLIWGTLLGLFVQFALVASELHRRGIKLAWRVRTSLKPVATAGLAIVPGLVFANLTALIPQIIAARLGDGAVSAFSFASRLHGAATQVLAMALSTVLLPYFALAIGRGDHAAISAALRKAFPVIAVVATAALLCVALVGEFFVALAFEHGAFDKIATSSVSTTWFWLTAGLLPAIWGVVLAKVLQAMRLGAVLSAIALLGLSVALVLSVVLADSNGLAGLAIATTLAVTATAACNALVAKKRLMSAATPDSSPVRIAIVVVAIAAVALVSVGADSLLSGTPVVVHLIGTSLVAAVASMLAIRALISPMYLNARSG